MPSPSAKRLRTALALILTGAVLWLLSQVPYQILREERIRAFGETEVRAVVTGVAVDDSGTGRTWLATYRYIGPEGMTRERRAAFPPEVWERLAPGRVITVYYANGEPNISRAQLEAESAFRVGLRRLARGDDLPEKRKKMEQ